MWALRNGRQVAGQYATDALEAIGGTPYNIRFGLTPSQEYIDAQPGWKHWNMRYKFIYLFIFISTFTLICGCNYIFDNQKIILEVFTLKTGIKNFEVKKSIYSDGESLLIVSVSKEDREKLMSKYTFTEAPEFTKYLFSLGRPKLELIDEHTLDSQHVYTVIKGHDAYSFYLMQVSKINNEIICSYLFPD